MQPNVLTDWPSSGLKEARLTQESRQKIVQLDQERQLKKGLPFRANSLALEVTGVEGIRQSQVDSLKGVSVRTAKRKGIMDAFGKTCERWCLSQDEQVILLGYNPHDVIGQLVLSRAMDPLSQDIRDRVGLVVGISLGLGALFEDAVDAELDWLRAKRLQLEEKSALEYMLEGRIAHLFVVADIVSRERGL